MKDDEKGRGQSIGQEELLIDAKEFFETQKKRLD